MRKPLAALVACAAAMAATGASGDTNYVNAVVYCKARIMPSGDQTGEVLLSVSLPETPGAVDENGWPVTLWNVGDVTAGGVADSWHAEGGPGRFTVRNTGNVAAYVYVTTGLWPGVDRGIGTLDGWEHLRYIYPNSELGEFPRPTPRMEKPNVGMWRESYHLALSTDVTAKAPTWRSLDRWGTWFCSAAKDLGNGYYGLFWHDYRLDDDDSFECGGGVCAAYLAYMPVGEYQPFDLKFWAPLEYWGEEYNFAFIFRVEASLFPRWEHDR
jgi:hypothetical protein